MGTLNVDGFGSFTVDDSFGKLPHETQKLIVDELRAKLTAGNIQQPKSFGQKLSEFWEETPVSFSPFGIAKGAYEAIRAFPKTLEASLPSALNDPNAVGDPGRMAAQTDIATLALGRPSAPSAGIKAIVPTREEIRAKFKAGYKALEDSGALIKKDSVDSLTKTIKNRLEKEGHRDFNQPSAFRNVARLGEIEKDASITDIDAVRQALGEVIRDNPGKSESVAARKAVGMIDEFLSNVSEKDIAPQIKLVKTAERKDEGFPGRAVEYTGKDASGNPVVKAYFEIEGENARLEDIHAIGPEGAALPAKVARNTLGTGAIKSLFQQFRELNPEVKTINANRISGARLGGEVDTGAQNEMRLAVPSKISSGSSVEAKEAVKTLKETQKEYAVYKRSGLVEKQMSKAKRQAAKTYSGGNIENAIRQKIGTIVEGIKDEKLKGFSKEETEALEAVVNGGTLRNLLRKMGKFSPTGVIPGLAELAALLHGDMGAALAFAGTGLASKKTAEFLAKKAAREADELIRSRSSLARPGQPANKKANLQMAVPPAFGYSALIPQNQ